MDSSDPKISDMNISKRIKKKKKLPIPQAVLRMLAVPEESDSSGESSDEEEPNLSQTGLPETLMYLDDLVLEVEEDMDQ